MISTTFIEQPGLSINLPGSGAEPIERQNRDLHLYLTASGEIYLDQNKLSKAALIASLSSYNPDIAKNSSFIIMADRATTHGLVVEIMDIARSSGFTNLAIATDPSAEIQQEEEATP